MNNNTLVRSITRKNARMDQGQPGRLIPGEVVTIGVEIELERFNDPGRNLQEVLDAGWKEEIEGSIIDGREFVMNPPVAGAAAEAALLKFFGAGFEYTPSERAGVHIHVNMCHNVYVGQLRSMLMLAYVIEGATYRIADENRKWASYCCPLIDMPPARLDALFTATDEDDMRVAFNGTKHEDKYYGLNLASLMKHGTVELRYFPSTTSRVNLLRWVNLATELRNAGTTYKNPSDMAEALLADMEGWITAHMPKSAQYILQYIDMHDAVQRVLHVQALLERGNVYSPAPVMSPALQRFLDRQRERRNNGEDAVKVKAEKKAPELPDEMVIAGDIAGEVGELLDLARRIDAAQRRRAAGE